MLSGMSKICERWHIILMSALGVILFLGGWVVPFKEFEGNGVFGLKVGFLLI